jgi:Flp pilus assembly protein TadB
MGGTIVGLLPAFVLLAFSLIHPEFPHMLFHDPAGTKILRIAVGLDVTALFVIRRILQVKY